MDIDNDGDFDIIITGRAGFPIKGWWIQIFEQTGKRIFKDVTNERLGNVEPVSIYSPDTYSELLSNLNLNQLFQEKGWVMETKDPFAIDIDNDGDYDILPIGPNVESLSEIFGYTDNFYYENIDGVFYERWYNDPEE